MGTGARCFRLGRGGYGCTTALPQHPDKRGTRCFGRSINGTCGVEGWGPERGVSVWDVGDAVVPRRCRKHPDSGSRACERNDLLGHAGIGKVGASHLVSRGRRCVRAQPDSAVTPDWRSPLRRSTSLRVFRFLELRCGFLRLLVIRHPPPSTRKASRTRAASYLDGKRGAGSPPAALRAR